MKMAPIIRELERKKIEHYVIHTGQHYNYNLAKIFFENLGLKKPKYNLKVGPKLPGSQTAVIISKTEKILIKTKPDVVLVPGDTLTALAGALAARKLDIRVGHVEAGLRSYDEIMPEEWNRRLIDHCSDYLFAPTNTSKQILLNATRIT